MVPSISPNSSTVMHISHAAEMLTTIPIVKDAKYGIAPNDRQEDVAVLIEDHMPLSDGVREESSAPPGIFVPDGTVVTPTPTHLNVNTP